MCDINATCQPRRVDWNECTCVNNDDFTVLVKSVGVVDTIEWACVLCGLHIQNDWESRAMNLHQILPYAWTFLHRNYSDDSEGHSYEQLVIGSFIMTTSPLMQLVLCRVFLRNIKSPRWLRPLEFRFGALRLDFWLFPKLKSPLKGKRFQTMIQGNTTGQLVVIGRMVWGPKVPTLKRIEVLSSYVQCFMYLVSSSINVSTFHIMWLDILWTGFRCMALYQ